MRADARKSAYDPKVPEGHVPEGQKGSGVFDPAVSVVFFSYTDMLFLVNAVEH
jgi:hypothetical protein